MVRLVAFFISLCVLLSCCAMMNMAFAQPPDDSETKDITPVQGLTLVQTNSVQFMTQPATPQDVSKLRALMGVAEEGTNYAVMVNGHGTGLAPPSESDWVAMSQELQVIASVQKIGGSLNTTVDHSKSIYFPPIGNQDGEGSCTCFATGYYMRTFQLAQKMDWNLSGCQWIGGYSGAPNGSYSGKIISPDFIYHQINGGGDYGSNFDDALNLVYTIGAATYATMPYDRVDHTTWPSEAAYREAAMYRSGMGAAYFDIYPPDGASNITELKEWIDSGHLALIGVDAYKYPNMDSTDLWKNDTYSTDDENHANTIIGYNDSFGPYTENGQQRYGAFKIANSWGKGGWGGGDNNADGFYFISYECMKWKLGYAGAMVERDIYQPQFLSVFKVTHNVRGECEITLGIGSKASPTKTIRFDDYWQNGGSHPYPNNKMALDITDFVSPLYNMYNTNMFLKVYDGGGSTTGSIQYFAVEHYRTYTNTTRLQYFNATSDDPVVNTVQGSSVYAELMLSDIKGPDIVLDRTPATATTGDNLTFSAEVRDNVWVRNVTLEYWFEGLGHNALNMTWDDDANWTYTIQIPHSLKDVRYFLKARDLANNWNLSFTKVIDVLDNDMPVLFNNTTPVSGTTGDPFVFEVNATDNIGIYGVTAEYWFGTGPHTNLSLDLYVDGMWRKQVFLSHTLEDMKYDIKVNDTSNNQNSIGTLVVAMSDNDLPAMIRDNTPMIAAVGHPLEFNATVTDNIAVSAVTLELHYPNGTITNETMAAGVGSDWTFDIPSVEALADLEYRFKATDTSSNANQTSLKIIQVLDIDLPRLITDLTPATATTGDPFTFSLEVSDNIAVGGACVEYWYGTGTHTNATMTPARGDHYRLGITAAETLTPISYLLRFHDAQGNWNATSQKQVQMMDNDRPVLTAESSQTSATTGDEFQFLANLTDNIGIGKVTLEYWFGTQMHVNVSMNLLGPLAWNYTIRIPNALSPLNYYVWFNDTSGNGNRTAAKTIQVQDNDPPKAKAGQDIEVISGTMAVFRASESTDNIGIVNYTWQFKVDGKDIVLYGISLGYTFITLGDVTVTLTVKDAAGLRSTDQVRVFVLRPDNVTDDDIVIDDDTTDDDTNTSDDDVDDDTNGTDDDVDDDVVDDDNGGNNLGLAGKFAWLWILLAVLALILIIIAVIVIAALRRKKTEEVPNAVQSNKVQTTTTPPGQYSTHPEYAKVETTLESDKLEKTPVYSKPPPPVKAAVEPFSDSSIKDRPEEVPGTNEAELPPPPEDEAEELPQLKEMPEAPDVEDEDIDAVLDDLYQDIEEK